MNDAENQERPTLEQRVGIGEPAKLTLAFFGGDLDGISEDEFARYIPVLHEIFPRADLLGLSLEIIDSIIKPAEKAGQSP